LKRVPWLRGAALAKITLSLRVLGTRPDGYHDIEALTVSTTGPADFVHLNRRTRPGATMVVTPNGAAPAGPDNLVLRAIGALDGDLRLRGGLRVRLRKQIPMGAGLGGGSSDAATVLRLLGHVSRIPEERLLEIAAGLGADVPFCLRGTPAWMRGRGELLEPVALEPVPLIVAVPPFRCSTPAVYAAWDELGGPPSTRSIPAPPQCANLLSELVNDLEPAAEHFQPALIEFRERFEGAVDRPALLCGSGSAYAACFDDADSWRNALDSARRVLPHGVFAGTSI
jgi:4-diphosphocytidyl-2-C-methyl-D-erythritol kinase